MAKVSLFLDTRPPKLGRITLSGTPNAVRVSKTLNQLGLAMSILIVLPISMATPRQVGVRATRPNTSFSRAAEVLTLELDG